MPSLKKFPEVGYRALKFHTENISFSFRRILSIFLIVTELLARFSSCRSYLFSGRRINSLFAMFPRFPLMLSPPTAFFVFCFFFSILQWLKVCTGFPGGSSGKESACSAADLGSIPGLGRSPGEGKGYPLQYSGLENSMDCIVYGDAKSWTRLSAFH